MDKDAQEALARQLATQFASLRAHRPPQTTAHDPPHSNVIPAATPPSSDANVASMAAQLSQLLTLSTPPSSSGPVASQPLALDAIPSPSIYEKDFVDTFQRVNESVLRFENRELLDMASNLMPIGRFYEEAETMATDFPEDGLDDIVIRRLLHWFKNEFFTWVNEPPCVKCQAKTVALGGVAPTAAERANGAGVVESYGCSQDCSELTRFPRYGGMSKILFETRKGRCGEWANCFTVCCRALGYRARYVHDTTDHVWTEVWSENKSRWIHCDSCEAAYDQPLLYTTGWGKSLSYCVAFSAEEVVDVTRRYTVDYNTVVFKRRRSCREAVFAKFLLRLSESNLARLGLGADELQTIRKRQALEMDELAGKLGDNRAVETNERESGSLEWGQARGERR